MKSYIIAWRNLWRNRKRTFITIAAVVLAVFLSTFMSSMQEGTYSKMIDNVVNTYSGYIQIHNPDYWETKSINDLYEPTDELITKVKNTEHVQYMVPRLESFTLYSTGENTKGGALIGIDPEKEKEITNLSRWVKQGEYLNGEGGILMAVNLAKRLKLHIGDTVILMSGGYHGKTAAGLYPLKGILEFPSPDMNNYGAFMHIKDAQEFYKAPGLISSMALKVDDYKNVNETKKLLESKINGEYSVKTWEELQPEIVQMIEQDRGQGIVMKAILYIVIGFGLLGTIIMMISERKRELAIMIAIGMQRLKLQSILFFETLYIGLIGIITGFVMSTPIMAFLVNNPVPLPGDVAEAYEKFGFEPYMYFSLMPKVFTNQVITVFIITMVVMLYPYFTVAKMKLMNAIRG